MPAPFVRETGILAPLLRDNVDTDAIIPSREMRSVGKDGLADGLFAGWRYTAIGSRDPDPEFVLNMPRYAGARFLLSGLNFGCGSSREHAAWALAEYGFRAVLARSFNPIFFGNCSRNGIVPVELPETVIDRLASYVAEADDPQVTVDLEACEVIADIKYPFALDGEVRAMLLHGLDPIALTLQFAADVDAFRARDRELRPWVYL